jgi:uncharacterized repeat protein (TIGR03943 family)
MGEPLAPLRRAALWRAAGLGLWSAVLLRSAGDGRLDLLLRAIYHPLVTVAGGLLLGLALLQLAVGLGRGGGKGGREAAAEPLRPPQLRILVATTLMAALLLALPPAPSFADLAGQRPRDETGESELAFVLPPAQRTLTDWVRLIRSQPDPRLFAGDPVRISGFLLPVADDHPQLARLLVRCCLADAAPVGLPVRWPREGPPARADAWFAIEGAMAVERHAGRDRLVVVPRRLRPIPRPERPLEP